MPGGAAIIANEILSNPTSSQTTGLAKLRHAEDILFGLRFEFPVLNTWIPAVNSVFSSCKKMIFNNIKIINTNFSNLTVLSLPGRTIIGQKLAIIVDRTD